jgi:branched-chain amino acid transport system permease protein
VPAIIELGQHILNGISQACVYALLASGLTLILGVLNVPNFAHGHLYMMGAYVAFYLVVSLFMNYWLALILATIGLGIAGLVIERIIFRPLLNAPEENLFVAAMGLLMILEGIALYFFGAHIRWLVTPYTQEVFRLAGLALQFQRLIIIGGTIIVMVSLQLFVKKTTIGATLEATAQNREGAMLCGIKVGWVAALAFAIGTAMAGVAGVLVGPSVQIMPTMGMGPLLIAFSAVIFGGLGSIPGAMLGALVMGMVESLSAGYVSGTYSWVFIFGIMILVLLFRPTGLLGETS